MYMYTVRTVYAIILISDIHVHVHSTKDVYPIILIRYVHVHSTKDIYNN